MRVIAHRGDSEHAPENTLAAFTLAKSKGSQQVEFDVMLTKDKIPIVIHDDTLERTTNGEGVVGECDWSYIQTLSAGCKFLDEQYKNEKIPTLSQTIGLLVHEGLDANIELKPCKGSVAEETAGVVLDILAQQWPKDKKLPLISSFNIACLEYVQQHAPEYPRAFLFSEWRDDCCEEARRLGCCIVTTDHEHLTDERVTQMKNAEFQVFAYTVGDVDRAKELQDWGVDAIFSNDPLLLKGCELGASNHFKCR